MKRLHQTVTASALALGFCLAPVSAWAQSDPRVDPLGVSVQEPGETGYSRSLNLAANKSVIVELDRPAVDVIITNPAIADATVQTANRIIFRGVEAGQTNAFIFDRNGRPILNLEISVAADTTSLNELITRYVPNARVTVEGVNDTLVVSGIVDNLMQSDQVMRLVNAYMPEGDVTPINMMTIRAKDQVMMEVRIVEMQRSVIKQLGISLGGTTNFGDFANQVERQAFGGTGSVPLDLGTTGLFPGPPYTFESEAAISNTFGIQGASLGGLGLAFDYINYNGVDAQSRASTAIDALERIGVVRTLAEPNITAVSGESANFLAGGEFPVPVASDEDGITVEFKPYGVGLAFTPLVLSEGRISLKISTEISELSNQGAFQGASAIVAGPDGSLTNIPGLTIPALVVRRAESVVELPSGGSTMLAGLIQSRSRQTLDQLPGIKKLPILGSLFQSRDFENQETEMVVIVTPYLVEPGKKDEFSTPADGFVNASDPKTIFFGKLNAQYADAGKGLSKENYSAPVGFIEE